MMDDLNRRDRIKHAHTHLDEDRCPAEHAFKSNIGTAVPPPRPLRVHPGRKGPAVNRDLKPRRLPKSSSDGRLEFMASAERACAAPQRPVRSLPRDHISLPPTPAEQSGAQHTQHTHTPRLSDDDDEAPPSRPAPQPHTRHNTSSSRPAWTEPSPGERKSVKAAQSSAAHASHRFSLDLESQDLPSGSEIGNCSSDPDVRKQLHHEWPPAKGENNSSFRNHSKPAQDLAEQNWYVGSFSRVDAEHALHLVNREGAFLVRDCSKNTTHEPLVLAVFYDKRVFNIQIRFSEEIGKYTLGTGLRTNDRFDSVTDIIRFHSIFPIVLIDGRRASTSSDPRRQCVLTFPITRQDLIQLLQ